MITKDGRHAAIEDLTPDNYIVPSGEERAYHCVIEVVQYDPKTGKKISKPRIQKFGKKAFENTVRDSLLKQGYQIKVLYDPNAYIAKQAEKAKESAEAKKQAEQEKFDAAVAAAVAQALEAAKVTKPADAPDYESENPEYAKKPGRKKADKE